MYQTPHPPNNALPSRFDRPQQLSGGLNFPLPVRALTQDDSPPLNVLTHPKAVEVYALDPGLDPARLELNIDGGRLSLPGERGGPAAAGRPAKLAYWNARYSGKFRRTLTLPEALAVTQAEAKYQAGVLRITLQRTPASQAKRVAAY